MGLRGGGGIFKNAQFEVVYLGLDGQLEVVYLGLGCICPISCFCPLKFLKNAQFEVNYFRLRVLLNVGLWYY